MTGHTGHPWNAGQARLMARVAALKAMFATEFACGTLFANAGATPGSPCTAARGAYLLARACEQSPFGGSTIRR